MEHARFVDVKSDCISITRCRELLSDEAEGLSDQEVDLMRRHADAMAHVLVEIFLDISADFKGYAADQAIVLEVDVHAHGHLLLDLPKGETAEYAFRTKLIGSNYLVIIQKGTLTETTVGKLKHPH